MVQTQSFLPETYHVAAVVRPIQEGESAYYVQNEGIRVTPFTEIDLPVTYGGGRNVSYELYVGLTQDPDLFKVGKMPQRPMFDREGRQVYWLGPVTLTKR
jgi:hypothetical protein